MLNGFKTYIVAIMTIVYAGVQYWNGTMDIDTVVKMVLAALGLAAVRNAIKSVNPVRGLGR